MPTLTILEAAKMWRIPRSTLFGRVARAGLVSDRGRYPAHLLEAVAHASRARPRIELR